MFWIRPPSDTSVSCMLHAYPLFSPIRHIATCPMPGLQSTVKWRIEIVGLAVRVWADQVMTPVRLMNDTRTDL